MFSERTDRLTGSLIREILALTQKPQVISFAGGLPAPEALPVPDLTGLPASISQYGPSEGEPELREVISHYLCGMGVRCRPEQVLITSGSQQGLDLTAKLFIDRGTPVALEAPSYLAAIQAFRFFGADFQELALGPEGIDPEQLRHSLARRRPAFVYLIPSFQNPSGVCYSRQTREAVAQVLLEAGVPLLEDEPYRELVYEAADRTPICSLVGESTWMLMGTFSKTGIPGFRIGYLVASDHLMSYLVRIKQATDLHSNRIGQWWSARFLGSTEFQVHLQRLRDFYRLRRDAMQAGLERHFGDIATWERPRGGLFFWVRLNRELDTRALLVRALERDVAFMPGEPFFPNPGHGGGYLRLNFSHAEPDRLERGLEVLAATIRETLERETTPTTVEI